MYQRRKLFTTQYYVNIMLYDNKEKSKLILQIISELKIKRPKECPLIWYSPADPVGALTKSKIERMKELAKQGKLPTRATRTAIQSKNDIELTSNTIDSEKPSQNRFTGQKKEEINEPQFNEKEINSMHFLEKEYAEKLITAEVKKVERIYTDSKTGYTSTYKGGIWYSAYRNAQSRANFDKKWQAWNPYIKKCYLLTITPYNEDLTGDWNNKIKALSKNLKKLLIQMRRNCGAIIFWSLEWSSGSTLHAHLIVGTCEEREDFYKSILDLLEKSVYSGCYHIQDFDKSGNHTYLIKSLSTGVDKMYKKLQDKEELSDFDYNALTIYKLASDNKVRFFGSPNTLPDEESPLPTNTLKAMNGEEMNQTKKDAKIRHILEREPGQLAHFLDLSNKQKALEIFNGTVCQMCHRDCTVAHWLQKYLYNANSIYYKDLRQFVADGY